ncbi:subtilisin-like protease SBT1.8 [Aegilops tauschii subsp. strangulata]|uniref:Subtilisin-like protease n=1 Tax=Aegilops tauschii TaxID=37682 RepID=N1QSL9_AEGTA
MNLRQDEAKVLASINGVASCTRAEFCSPYHKVAGVPGPEPWPGHVAGDELRRWHHCRRNRLWHPAGALELQRYRPEPSPDELEEEVHPRRQGLLRMQRQDRGSTVIHHGRARQDHVPEGRQQPGTYVAATAVGAKVRDAGVGAFARSDASGVAPRVRLSVYRACTNGSCSAATVVAAIEAAVKGGVDVLAEWMGIPVVVSGGNSGPAVSTVNNAEPWVVTVGASTQDRMFPAKLKLGNDDVLTGQSLYKAKAMGTPPAGLVHNQCKHGGDMTPDLVTDKVLVCPCYEIEDFILLV